MENEDNLDEDESTNKLNVTPVEYTDASSDSPAFKAPNFNISSWSPEAPAGMNFLSLVPFLDVGNSTAADAHTGKIKVSKIHRQQRLNIVRNLKTTCRNIVDERRLRNACNQNDLITVIELLDGGANPSGADEKKRTPLHFAASQGYEKIVKLLLDRGADTDMKDFIGNTPLHLAACTCQVPIVTLLLRAGTDIKSVDQYGRTPLTLAKSRLKMLGEEQSYSNDRMRKEVIQISEMMKTYLDLTGCHDDADQLDDLCKQLQQTTTREEVDRVNSVLTNFANLSLQKKES